MSTNTFSWHEELAGSPDVWTLTCRLLDVARHTAGDLAREHSTVDVHDLAHRYFEDHGPVVGPDELALLRQWLDGLEPLELGKACYAIASAIDDRCWVEFTDLWLSVGDRRRLREGEWIPVVDHPYIEDFDPSARAVRPGSIEVRGLDTAHVRKFRQGSTRQDITLIFDRSLDAAIQGALGHGQPLRSASVVPNRSLSEEIANYSSGFPIGPASPDRQAATLVSAIDVLADESGPPHLVVVPELAVDGAIQEKLAAATSRHAELAWLVVAGSRHDERDGSRRNIATIAIPHHPRRDVHDKISPAAGEDIDPGDTITVLVGGRHRLAVVICLDLMKPLLADLLGEVGVTIVAVPAMSEKTDNFLHAAGQLAGRAQPLVVVANSPRLWPNDRETDRPPPGRDGAIFCQPVAGNPYVRHPSSGEPPSEPAIWAFQMGDTQAKRLGLGR